MTIHREGFKIIFITTLILSIINGAIWMLLPEESIIGRLVMLASLVVFILVLQFFRNPNVKIEHNPNHIIAPADGKVVVIEEVDEPEFLKEKRRQISIFMSPINVHVNRNPVSGFVKYLKYHPGKYLVAWHPKSSTENERTTIVLETDKGVRILFRQIAGAVAKRIKWYVKEGMRVKQGDEFGFIKFGSRVDIFIPLNAKVKVEIGQKTTGGKTVLAEFD